MAPEDDNDLNPAQEGGAQDQSSEDDAPAQDGEGYNAQMDLAAASFRDQTNALHFGVTKVESEKVPLWLVTFTDVMALMLTFFVLLYSMSVPQEETWEELTQSLNNKIGRVSPPKFHGGSQETIAIGRIDKTRALDLGYVRALLQKTISARGIEDIILAQNGNELILSLPAEMLFTAGSAEVSDEGKQTIFVIGGVLDRIKNRIEVIGNTDPEPIRNTSSSAYRNNWELSLARSASVASALRSAGYDKPIILKGFSSARYDELSPDLPREERYSLARRVDIVLMDDQGYRKNAFDIE